MSLIIFDDHRDLKEAIISACAGGRLLSWLSNDAGDATASEREITFTLVEELHKTGEIDALGALLNPSTQWEWTPDWSARQHILTALIPRLTSSVGRMMYTIGAIEARMVQHVLDDAFLSWCEAAPVRAAEVIGLIDGGTHVPDRFVLAALISGLRTRTEEYLSIAASIAKGDRPGSRHIGARALRLIPQMADASIAYAVEALRSIIEDRGLSGAVRADALSASIEIAVRVPTAPSEQFIALLQQASEDPDVGLVKTCATAFGRHALGLPPPLFDCMLEILSRLKSEDLEAFDAIDIGLAHLLSTPNGEDRVLRFIEALARREDSDVVLERLDSTMHAISNGSDPRLSRVVVRWLLSGEASLCHTASKLVRGVYDRELLLSIDFYDSRLSDAQALFLARKAIGWFPVQPEAATSLIISLVPQVTEAGAEPLGDLLFDPLLMNYPGSVRRLIEAAAPTLSGVAKEIIERTVTKHDSFQSAIKAVGKVPELHQSERNRRIEIQRQNDKFSTAKKDAEKQSVFMSIVQKTMLLHGARTVSYVEDFGGKTRRLDNKLGRISTEMEQPMLWTWDPLGLEYALLMFRIERPPE